MATKKTSETIEKKVEVEKEKTYPLNQLKEHCLKFGIKNFEFEAVINGDEEELSILELQKKVENWKKKGAK